MVGENTIVGSPRNNFELPESHQYFSRGISSGFPESDRLLEMLKRNAESTQPFIAPIAEFVF